WPDERIDIPYEGSSMPGWFFRPDDADGPRRTMVMTLGSDEALTGIWGQGVEGGLERGYNVVLYEGPGQQSMLFERGIPFRPDWENVLTPVVDHVLTREDVLTPVGDHVLTRDDVDPGRLALYGVSQGGYWVPRALAFEHRFAAAIADGGVVDMARSWHQNIPHLTLSAYLKGDKERFDKELELAFRLPGTHTGKMTWNFRSLPYSVSRYCSRLDAG